MRILGVVSSSSREVPNAPTIGTATDIGTARAFNNGAATVTFTAPTFDGGLPITGYTVTSSPGGFTATGAGSPLTVAGLASNTGYTFTAVATNSRGNSASSAASNSITATTVPQAPTIGTATDLGTGSTVSVSFTGNANGGKAISTYTVTSSPGGITASGASSPITVSGLTAGTAYTFTVTATNANGTSAASAASNSVTPAVPTSFDSIATATPSGVNTVTFSSIPQGYKHLQLRILSRTDVPTDGWDLAVRFNNDSGQNYTFHRLIGNGGSAVADSTVSSSRFTVSYAGTGSSIASNIFGTGIVDIHDYTSTTKNKTVRMFSGANWNASTNVQYITLSSALWVNTSAINRIDVLVNFSGSNFVSGTSIALYGIKG
jgi:hypothetical protein